LQLKLALSPEEDAVARFEGWILGVGYANAQALA
jgi:hypothetical protein